MSATAVDDKLVAVTPDRGGEAAVMFVHGFGGGVMATWGAFPALVADALTGWDVYDLGYDTSLAPDLRGVWAADPGLAVLATYLATRLGVAPLDRYASVVLVAHSMGGLVVQRALVDDPDLDRRVSHVFLFGTPSGGLRKAGGLAALWKRSIGDMRAGGNFIGDLRARWDQRYSDPTTRPFGLFVVAGTRDEFVPAASSLEVFADAERHVVSGNHVEIVKPDGTGAMSVQLVVKGIRGDAAPSGPWNSARVAVETKQFQRAIDLLEGHAGELDDEHLVALALAVEEVRSTEEALALLRTRPALGTDARGVLAGRLKRRWLLEGRAADAGEALRLYAGAYAEAVAAGDAAQALYHGINVAFLQAVSGRDRPAAQATARDVLEHCQAAPRDHWCEATEGEALLHLGGAGGALAAYRRALEHAPSPRELASMYHQGALLAERLGMDDTADALAALFRGGEGEPHETRGQTARGGERG